VVTLPVSLEVPVLPQDVERQADERGRRHDGQNQEDREHLVRRPEPAADWHGIVRVSR
jgi:hypothetical protein